MEKIFRASVLFYLFFCLVQPAQATPYITEVMYDPNSGGEWVEIFNPDDAPIDLKGWKIFDGSSHTISVSAIVPSSGYIILADDKSAFVSAFNSITTTIIDIVTSFNNDGDTVILRSPTGTDMSTMSYTSSAGASKNAKTLQLIEGNFLPWLATPGADSNTTKAEAEAAAAASNTTSNTTQTSTAVQPTPSSPYHAWPSDMQLYVSAGGDKVALAGAEVVFEGRVLSAAKKSLPNADLIWTFGDGGSDRGTQVKHTFHYPGNYVVLLDVISGDYIDKDQIQVEVIKPNIEVSAVQTGERQYIELFNNTIHDLDIGGFILEAGGLTGTHFTVPKHTILLSGRKIIFPSAITKLIINSTNVSLKFPNGEVLASYDKAKEGELLSETVSIKESSAIEIQNLADSNITQSYSTNILPSIFSIEDTAQTVDEGVVPETAQATSSDVGIIENNPLPMVAAASATGFDITKHPRIIFSTALLAGIMLLFSVLGFIDKKERESLGISEEADSIKIIE